MTQKFLSWGEGAQSWHGEQVSPAGCPEQAPHPLLEPGCSAAPVAQLMRPEKVRRAPGTAAPWLVLFCHGSQWLPFEGCFFICCSPFGRRTLGAAWSRGFCSDLRGWQCQVAVSRA